MSGDTFATFAATVLAQRAEDGIRGISSETNRFQNHISGASFADMLLAEIRSKHIREWLREMARKDAADTRGKRKLCVETIKRAFSLVSAIFGAAVEQELIESNPCIGVKAKKRADENSTRDKWAWLTLDEQKLIASCAAIPSMDRLMIRIAIGTGMRQGEQCNLPWSDVHEDEAEPYIRVRFGSLNKPPKNGKARSVPIFPHVIDTIRTWRQIQPEYAPENPDDLVFPTPRGTRRGIGKPLGNGGVLKKYLALVGITRRCRWHDLRHSCASSLVSGVWGKHWSLEMIRPVMGHASITTTQRYAHIGQSALAAYARETTRGLIMPPAAAIARVAEVPVANDTSPDLSTWFEQEAVAS